LIQVLVYISFCVGTIIEALPGLFAALSHFAFLSLRLQGLVALCILAAATDVFMLSDNQVVQTPLKRDVHLVRFLGHLHCQAGFVRCKVSLMLQMKNQ
jgi:hypothetical protein